MPVITRASSRLLTMFNQTSPSDTQPAQQAQPASVATPPSPLDRLLGHFETLLSHIQNSSPTTPTTSSISQPGRNLDSDGRNGSGGRIGFKQGSRASPIAGASVSGQPETDVSHSPTRLPMPDTTQPTGSLTLSDPGQPSPIPTPSSSSNPVLRELDADGGGDNERRPLEFKQGSRAPPGTNPEVSHSPPRLSSGPTLFSNTVRSSSNIPPGQNLPSSPTPIHNNLHPLSSPMTSKTNMMDNTKGGLDLVQNMLAPGDDPSENFTPQGGNRWQNFSSANADSTGATTHGRAIALISNIPMPHIVSPRLIPSMAKIIKYEYPKLTDDPALLTIWRARFIACICSTELEPLYDHTTRSLVKYGFYINNEDFRKYDINLYSRILQALPDTSTFINSTEYLSRGIALWHALMEDHNSTGAVHNTHILLPALYAMHRKPQESVDAYWNRFHQHVAHIRRDINAPTLNQAHLRLQFLITLGGTEFSFLKTDWEDSSLDPMWTTLSDDDLKSALRLI